MADLNRYPLRCEPHWLAVEQFFARLPPALFRQAVLLKDNLSTFYTGSGQFKDLLSREQDHPLLYWHLWLLDDLGGVEAAQQSRLEKHIFLAMVFTFAGVYTQETIWDEGSNFDPPYLLLGQTLQREAERQLTLLFPPDVSFWSYQRRYWEAYAEAALIPPSAQLIEHPQLIWGKLAFSKISIAAAAIGAAQEPVLPHLEPVLDQLNLSLQTLREISTLRRDLNRRHYSYPLQRTLQAAGLDPRQALSPEQILGAAVLTGAVAQVGRECLARLEACRDGFLALRLPTFAAYCETVAGLAQEIIGLFSLKKREKVSPRLLFAPHEASLPRVIEMAEGYLLADLTFRESWEIQRRGVFGVAELVGQAFPVGLIVEVLCQNGHELAEPLDTVFEILHRSGCRYYEHHHLPPDADDLGLLLRLYPFSSQPEVHREIVQSPLRELQTSILPGGEIPVWLLGPEAAGQYTQVAMWGNRCAAVEANLLLGLIAYDWPRYRSLVEPAIARLAEQWSSRGFSATAHYVPLYGLWVTLELVAQLGAIGEPSLKGSLNRLEETLLALLTREAGRAFLSAQDRAFLVLSCLTPVASLETQLKMRLKPEWLAGLYKSQRYDGSWAGEPLYGTPTRGEFAAWYSSRTVTTAFCYHALKRYQATQPPA